MPSTVGTSDEELEEIRLGRVPQQRIDMITQNMKDAAMALAMVEPVGQA